jgi:hypothetical protein
MQLVAFVEAEFGVAVADAELVPENFDSVERISRYVVRANGPGSAEPPAAVTDAARCPQ